MAGGCKNVRGCRGKGLCVAACASRSKVKVARDSENRPLPPTRCLARWISFWLGPPRRVICEPCQKCETAPGLTVTVRVTMLVVWVSVEAAPTSCQDTLGPRGPVLFARLGWRRRRLGLWSSSRVVCAAPLVHGCEAANDHGLDQRSAGAEGGRRPQFKEETGSHVWRRHQLTS